MRLAFFLFFLIFSCLAEAAVIDTLSVETCGHKEYPTKLESSVCQKLGNSDNFNSLSQDEKKRIIVNMLTKGETTVYDMHSFVDSWNRMLNFTKDKPVGAATSPDQGPIKNIWVATFSVFPSFEEDAIMYLNEDGVGTMQSGYHYNITQPTSFLKYSIGYSPGCGNSRGSSNPDAYGSGDCYTRYFGFKDSTSFRQKINGATVKQAPGNIPILQNGQNIITQFDNDALSYTFTSDLNTKYTFSAERGYWKGECCSCCNKKKGDTCKSKTRYTCEERINPKTGDNIWEYEYHADISHNYPKSVEKYTKPSYTNQITITDKNTDPVVEVVTDAPDYELKMGKASLSQFGSGYRVDWMLAPYNSLNVAKVNGTTTKFVTDLKMIDNEESLTLFSTEPKNTESCSISYHFPLLGKESASCVITEKYSPKLEIKTENLAYKKGDKIKVSVNLEREEMPAAGDVQITYCRETQAVSVSNGKGSAQFTAKPDCDTITAAFSDSEFTTNASAQFSMKKRHALVASLIIAFGFLIAIARFAWHSYWRQSI